jgi:putative endonuclease
MPFVYMLASMPHGTLYTGSTFHLARRVCEHKLKAVPGFTAKYGVDRLVWFEAHETLETALVRERQIKKWKRDWKINLIERDNPPWIDCTRRCRPDCKAAQVRPWVAASAGTRWMQMPQAAE